MDRFRQDHLIEMTIGRMAFVCMYAFQANFIEADENCSLDLAICQLQNSSSTFVVSMRLTMSRTKEKMRESDGDCSC